MGTTMPQYFEQTLQRDSKSRWDFSSWVPELVVVSLGGNDFNHQNGHVPSNATFTEAYGGFLATIIGKYRTSGGGHDSVSPTIVSICGQGTPGEKLREKDNDRCRPCPH